MAKADVIKPGELLGGKYRIERVIGEGGMGTVVAARHTELHQRIALKLLPADQAADQELAERFMREARAAARLKSEHAVKVMDVGRRSNGSPYIVMELLEGRDLGAIVERTPLSVHEAVDYILQACEAVAEAHALGIIHRDLKPKNLFLTTRLNGKPHVKVLDFGLAKRIDMQDKSLTATTAVMGSPQYMSPEQMKASRYVDFRTDIWSLGVCLYELVSTRVPFDSDAVPVLCAMVLKDDPVPLPSIRPDIPHALWHVIQRCLMKEPSDRYTTVAELAAALEPFAPPHARGAWERISAVLQGAQQTISSGYPAEAAPDSHDTRTNASFDSDHDHNTSSWTWAAIAVGALVGTCALVAILLFASPFRKPTAGRIQEPRHSYEPAMPATKLETSLPMASNKVGAGASATALPTSPATPVKPKTPPPATTPTPTSSVKPENPAANF